ncbi:MAG: PKD domain-containing protein [Candidatus Nanoarchaeia archaeon]
MNNLLQRVKRGMSTGLVALVTACGPAEMNIPSPDNGSKPSQDVADVYTPQPDAGFYDDAQTPDAGMTYADAMPKPDAMRPLDSGMYDAGMTYQDARTDPDAMLPRDGGVVYPDAAPVDSGSMGVPPICAPNLLTEYERAVRASLRLNLSNQPCNCSADPPLGSAGNPEMRMYRVEWGDYPGFDLDPDGLFSHGYDRSGTFQVRVYCTNLDGLTATARTIVRVP